MDSNDDLSSVLPEADSIEQQTPVDPDEWPDVAGPGATLSGLETASEADLIEQQQDVVGEDDYPRADDS